MVRGESRDSLSVMDPNNGKVSEKNKALTAIEWLSKTVAEKR